MHPTLRRLLTSAQLDLALLTPEPELPPGALDASVDWVHSSDLVDPTPFLESGQLLLTTGSQFVADDDQVMQEYVARLRDSGLVGLGFGTEVAQPASPASLVRACLRHGLPLFEVPYRVPFIAIAREVATLIAQQTYARQTWALAAQRSITNAALRPDGLGATLAELSRQLGHWVALFSSTGDFDRSFPQGAPTARMLDQVGHEVARLLSRGRRASATVEIDGDQLVLQTLGGGDRLRGVLVVGGGETPLDPASAGLVDSVIALAGLALEQNRDLEQARSNLRSGLLHALLGGGFDLASGIAHQMWGGIPSAPVRVAAVGIDAARRPSLTDFLEVRATSRPDSLFYAEQGDCYLVCMGDTGYELAAELVDRFGLSVGVSETVDWAGLSSAVTQARQARERAAESGAGVVEFQAIAREGVLAFLSRTDARAVSESMLGPIDVHDSANGTQLRGTLRSWLGHDGRFDAAAQELGVHRHTVRNRIALIEQLLGRDLRSFSVRADLWVALLASDGSPPAVTRQGRQHPAR